MGRLRVHEVGEPTIQDKRHTQVYSGWRAYVLEDWGRMTLPFHIYHITWVPISIKVIVIILHDFDRIDISRRRVGVLVYGALSTLFQLLSPIIFQ